MRPICCPETSVKNYHYTLRNDTEECSSHLLRIGSLNSFLCVIWRVSEIQTLRGIGNTAYAWYWK